MNGLPIGNYTSQHFGNLYLNQFDWWIKQVIKPPGYFRYCDDIVVFAETTKELVFIKHLIDKKLQQLGLFVKPTWNVFDVYKNGIDFVGYSFKPNQTRLRKSIAKNFAKNCYTIYKKIKVSEPGQYLSSVMSYKGWVKRCNALQLWRTHTTKLIRFYSKQLRSAV
jgi:RNA-directed DNA polymerase